MLVFTKRSLHISDPRPDWDMGIGSGDIPRVAMNVRIGVRPRGWCNKQTFPYTPGFTDVYYKSSYIVTNNKRTSNMGPHVKPMQAAPSVVDVLTNASSLPRCCGFPQIPVKRCSMLGWL